MIPDQLYGPLGALTVLAFMVAGFLHGDLVPGWVYRAALARAEKAETQAERNTDAIKTIADTVSEATRDRRARDA